MLSEGGILRFASVGAIGFIVDGTLLTLLARAGWSPAAARALSFPCAATITWLLHRAWTFAAQRTEARGGSYLLYIALQVAGALVNYVTFIALIGLYEPLRQWLLIPLAGGAVVALLFNYVTSRFIVFRKR